MAKKFIQKAIKHPGRVKDAAKRAGVSTHAEAEKMAHTKGSSHAAKSKRSAGILALRFQGGEFKHKGAKHGGSTLLKPGSMKAQGLAGRGDNLKNKKEFCTNQSYATTAPSHAQPEYKQ